MAWTYDLKTDLRYQQGKEEGIEKGIEQGIEKGIEKGEEKKATVFVENLLLTGEFSDEKIASLAAVNLEFVKKVKERLKLEGKITLPQTKNGAANGR